jgi:hypothetical protein
MKIFLLILLILLTACGESTKDLNLICSGTYKHWGDKGRLLDEDKYELETHRFVNGKLIVQDTDKNDKTFDVNIPCKWTENEIICSGNLSGDHLFEFYLDRVSGRAELKQSAKSFVYFISSGKCEKVNTKKF